MKKPLLLVAAIMAVWLSQGLLHEYTLSPVAEDKADGGPPDRASGFESGAQIHGRGVVVNVLPDDNDGSRHQRFVLRLESGRTVLIAHNIDVAPRIDALEEGDTVTFFGEFEPNDKGGVVHWTHRDPRGSHVDGWLIHDGRTFQ